jgi:hypothetical protein
LKEINDTLKVLWKETYSTYVLAAVLIP